VGFWVGERDYKVVGFLCSHLKGEVGNVDERASVVGEGKGWGGHQGRGEGRKHKKERKDHQP